MDTHLPVPWFARSHLRNRARHIAATLARHGLGWMVMQGGLGELIPFERGLLGHPKRESPYTQAEHLRMALGELGATFIKLGQAISTRPDMIPLEYVTELSKLQDAAPPVDFADICQTICDQLGHPPEDLFAEFNPEPLASASIGQVHAAILKDAQPVVVKVQRPDVAQQVDLDLEILSHMAAWAGVHTEFGRNHNLPALVEEFAYTLRNELDYRREGQNAERFYRNFTSDPGMRIPQVYWDFSSGAILTLERVSGIKIDDVAKLEEAGIDRRALAENAVRLMLREVFEFGFFHADPHPGNFFVQPDGSIALVDFGMVGRLNNRLQSDLLRMGMAVAQQDSEQLTDEFYAIGIAGGTVRRSVLQRDLDHFLSQYSSKSIKELATAQVMNEVIAVAFRNQLQLPSELMMLFRVVAMSEGLGARLDPEFQLFEYAAPFLQRFYLEKHSPKAFGVRVGRALLEATELGLDLPRHLARLFGQMERGEIEVNIKPEGMHEFTHQLQRMVNRLALSVLLAATIIALGLIMLVYHPAAWERYAGWIFALAFLFALGFGAWLMWTIWRSGRG